MNERMKELAHILNKHGYNYYVLDNPTISDGDYDKLYDELVMLEKQSGVVLENSPTRRVGGEPLDAFEKHIHLIKLFSLDKSQSQEGVCDFIQRTALAGAKAFTFEYKFDGLTLCLTYDGGKFVRATTRGSGVIGEDVTSQVMTIKTFPLEIDYKGKIEVVGEGVMLLSELERYNKENEIPLKNARNAIAGAIRNLDPKQTAKRKPQIFFYSINYIEDESIITSQSQAIEFLQRNKFKVSPFFRVIKGGDVEILKEQSQNILDEILKLRPTLDFLIDGVVIKVDNFQTRKELGETEKFPKWAIAFKFEADEGVTKLEDVVWQVGRTGKLTPLAILSPIELCGVTISRATLNNYGDILRKQVKKGDNVFIRRSNDVIPEVLGMAETFESSVEIEKVENCPDCGSKLKQVGAHIFCPNELNCPSQIIQRMTHFSSKPAMDIVGFSEKTAKQLFLNLNIRSPYELYYLTKDKLLSLEGIKGKKADNLINAITKSRKIPFAKFIFALGILNVGTKTAKDLAKTFENIEQLKCATVENLVEIDDVGDIVAQSIREFFDDEFQLKNLNKLLGEIEIIYPQKVKEGGMFLGMTVVLTGTLQNYSRTQATEIIEAEGGKVTSSVSKRTSLIVYGEEAGSKLVKGQQLGVQTMTEEEFMQKLSK